MRRRKDEENLRWIKKRETAGINAREVKADIASRGIGHIILVGRIFKRRGNWEVNFIE